MNDVKVTVLMPAYNAAKYVAEAIQSVLDQTFTDFELLIVNDCSTDKTVSEIQQFKDSRIRLVHQPRKGISAALNTGLHEARGNYIARFDADDICLPERLGKQVNFLDLNPDYVLAGADAEYIAENGEHLFNFSCTGHTDEEIRKQLYVYCPFIHSAVMYRKDAVLKAGGYIMEAQTFEDYLLWIRLAGHGLFGNLPEALIKVRLNPDSVTIDEKWRGQKFRRIKRKIIYKGSVSREESKELLNIINRQNTARLKDAAYNALCGKKFLVNNYQPQKARIHLGKAIGQFPFRPDNYALYVLSFFPKPLIDWLHSKSPNKI